MKKILTLSIILTFLGITGVYAQTTQTNSTALEVPIMGQTTVANLPAYISLIYNFAIGIVGLAALIMIGVGGYLYMTSHGNASQAERGKEFITDAIFGLVIVLVSYVILRTINPNLVGNFQTNFGGYSPAITTTSPQDNINSLSSYISQRYAKTLDSTNHDLLRQQQNKLFQLPFEMRQSVLEEFAKYLNGKPASSQLTQEQLNKELVCFGDIIVKYQGGFAAGCAAQ